MSLTHKPVAHFARRNPCVSLSVYCARKYIIPAWRCCGYAPHGLTLPLGIRRAPSVKEIKERKILETWNSSTGVVHCCTRYSAKYSYDMMLCVDVLQREQLRLVKYGGVRASHTARIFSLATTPYNTTAASRTGLSRIGISWYTGFSKLDSSGHQATTLDTQWYEGYIENWHY